MAREPDALEAAFASARVAWPGIALSRDAFDAWVVARAPAGPTLQGLHTDDLFLACACAGGDRAALRAFETRIIPRAEAAARSLDADRDFGSEVVQRVRTRLFAPRDDGGSPRIHEYRGRGPLAAWVGVTTTRVGLSLLRELRRAHRYDDDRWAAALVVPVGSDVELEYLKDRHRDDLGRALQDACTALPARERTVLRLAFVEGMTIDEIGAIYDVHRATAARWLVKGRAALFEHTRTRLAEILQVSPDEFSSFDRLLRSQLEVSLDGLLEE